VLQLLGKRPEPSIFRHTSLRQCYNKNEQEKKREYDQHVREASMDPFTPSFSTPGGMGPKSIMA